MSLIRTYNSQSNDEGIDGTQWTRYTYDGENVIVDTRSDGSRVYYGNAPGIDNKLWYTEEYNNTSSTVFFLTDHLGSTRALVSDSGAALGTITYDSFGIPVGITGTIGTRFLYAGRDYDADTELYYYRARWYDPQARRFICEDPIGLNGGINLYAYVGNNPVNRIDPWGLLDVYFFDQNYYPLDTGKAGTSYGASVYVVLDNGTVNGPYRGSTYPNSKNSASSPYSGKIINEGIYSFNNIYAHKEGTQLGLNIVDINGKREVQGTYVISGQKSIADNINIHAGRSDLGNYNSRGSTGCLTIHPNDASAFFSYFSFTQRSNGTYTGSSTGNVHVYRTYSQFYLGELFQLYNGQGQQIIWP